MPVGTGTKSERERRRPGLLNKLALSLYSLAPPRLSNLVAYLNSAEDFRHFVALIEEFLPERESAILTELTPARQVARFCNYFQDRYFPLDTSFLDWEESELESYTDIVQGVPVPYLSFNYEDYHEVPEGFHDDVRLILFLIECPWDNDEGARQVIGEACRDTVSLELLERVPQKGFARETLHKYLDKTRYEPIATWADRICVDTGNYFYDQEITRCGCGEGYIPRPDWDRATVEGLVDDWHKVEKVEADDAKLRKWLAKDYEKGFKEILDFLLEKERQANAKEKHGTGQAESEREDTGLQVEDTAAGE